MRAAYGNECEDMYGRSYGRGTQIKKVWRIGGNAFVCNAAREYWCVVWRSLHYRGQWSRHTANILVFGHFFYFWCLHVQWVALGRACSHAHAKVTNFSRGELGVLG